MTLSSWTESSASSPWRTHPTRNTFVTRGPEWQPSTFIQVRLSPKLQGPILKKLVASNLCHEKNECKIIRCHQGKQTGNMRQIRSTNNAYGDTTYIILSSLYVHVDSEVLEKSSKDTFSKLWEISELKIWRHVFKNGQSPASFSFIFGLFQTNINAICNKLMWKMSIQYTALGLEPTTYRKWVSSHIHYTRAPAQTVKMFVPSVFI